MRDPQRNLALPRNGVGTPTARPGTAAARADLELAERHIGLAAEALQRAGQATDSTAIRAAAATLLGDLLYERDRAKRLLTLGGGGGK